MGSIGANADSVVDVSVALSATDLESVPRLSAEIGSLGATISKGDNHARLELLRKARALVNALEAPRETMIKHCWAEVSSRLRNAPLCSASS